MVSIAEEAMRRARTPSNTRKKSPNTNCSTSLVGMAIANATSDKIRRSSTHNKIDGPRMVNANEIFRSSTPSTTKNLSPRKFKTPRSLSPRKFYSPVPNYLQREANMVDISPNPEDKAEHGIKPTRSFVPRKLPDRTETNEHYLRSTASYNANKDTHFRSSCWKSLTKFLKYGMKLLVAIAFAWVMMSFLEASATDSLSQLRLPNNVDMTFAKFASLPKAQQLDVDPLGSALSLMEKRTNQMNNPGRKEFMDMDVFDTLAYIEWQNQMMRLVIAMFVGAIIGHRFDI